MKIPYIFSLLLTTTILLSCNENNEQPQSNCLSRDFFSGYPKRNFKMGFTSWPAAPGQQAVDETYEFLADNADIYSEHIDSNIPWQAWMSGSPLPAAFTDNIDSRVANRIETSDLLVSISLLNLKRDDLAPDFDGNTPQYTYINDKAIEDAYVKHVSYIIDRLQPDFLVTGIEVNELKVQSETKWIEYKALMQEVNQRIRQNYPNLMISESVTLHTLYQPNVANPQAYIEEVTGYMNTMDFVSISYYPYLNQRIKEEEYQKVFDFLHEQITRPIAFVETAFFAEDLIVPRFGLNMKGDECAQNAYLETLLTNALEQNYAFIIWWAYKDFDELWQTFPEDLKDLGKLWRDTGLIDENNNSRMARTTWSIVLKK